jgi:hypothetical protein
MFDGSYGHFRDIPAGQLAPGQDQYFAQDISEAIQSSDHNWQGPSWDLFVYACRKQRPISIITARGHSPETIKAGVRLLANQGLIPREPHYHTIIPVGNDDVRKTQLGDPQLQLTTPVLKKRAIIHSVEKALQDYGTDPEHRFGMSDDDPANVRLIISAMCECKRRYQSKRFFVIDTHAEEMVKLEVFPVNQPVVNQPDDDHYRTTTGTPASS